MAFPGKSIHNPKTGQRITFLKTSKNTGGALLEMETTYDCKSKEPIPHYHPLQDEDFLVLSGELTVRIRGELKVLRQGDTLHVPRNTVHSMWNNTSNCTVVNWKVQPALQTEYFLETAVGLAAEGKTNENGVPGILQTSLLANKFSLTFRFSAPPFAVQRVVFALLTPFAYLMGYRPMYTKYID